MKECDFEVLIIGQGIAGSMLAHELIRRQVSFRIMDKGSLGNTSVISSGLINPVTGRRFVLSWMIDELLPAAMEVYSDMEKLLQTTLKQEVNIIRHLSSIREENLWSSNRNDHSREHYMEDEIGSYDLDHLFTNHNAFAKVKGGLRIFTNRLIPMLKSYLSKNNLLIEDAFNYSDLTIDKGSFFYLDWSFKYIVFAEGWHAKKNPFFQDLTYRPAKGEALVLRIPEFPEDAVIKINKFFLPLGNAKFWFGSTYEWSFEGDKPSSVKKQELISWLDENLTLEYEIIDHIAGVRPSTKDRRPFVGRHSKFDNMYVFNGLGTKGFSLAPYWAGKLTDLIFSDAELPLAVYPYR